VKQTCDANCASKQMRCGLWLMQELLYQFLPYQPGCGSTQTGLFKPLLTCSATRLNFQARVYSLVDCRVASGSPSRDKGSGNPSTPTPYSPTTPFEFRGSGRGIPAVKSRQSLNAFNRWMPLTLVKGTGLGQRFAAASCSIMEARFGWKAPAGQHFLLHPAGASEKPAQLLTSAPWVLVC